MAESDKEAFSSRINLEDLQKDIAQVRTEIHKVIAGQAEMVDYLMAALLADGHVLLEGVPGIAKTLAAKLIARTVSVDFARIQFTPDLMPSDVLGTAVFNARKADFEFKKGPIFANLVLIDEINRAPAKTQSALFEVMEERQITMDGATYKMASPFLVIATQNPIEQEGTYRLPEAQIDRFLFKINLTYPSQEDEAKFLRLLHATRNQHDIEQVQPVLNVKKLLDYQEKVRAVLVEEALIQYVVQIVQSTRKHPALYLGASPRASLAMVAGAKSFAAMSGRDFVTPEDIKRVAGVTLRHRLLLTPEREMEGVEPDEVVRQIVEKIEVPR